jgi:glutathione S-transferase
MMITLHVAPPSPRAFKVLAVARQLGLDFELRPVDLLNGEHLTPAFTQLNPNQKMPVLEEDGFVLWESNAITQYLAAQKPEAELLPTDPRGRVDVARWQFWESAHWDPACSTLIFERLLKKVFGQGDPDPVRVEKGEQDVQRLGSVLDGWLAKRKQLCGDRLTIADFSVGAWLNYGERAGYPIGDFRNVRRWYAGLMELPAWRESIVAPPF